MDLSNVRIVLVGPLYGGNVGSVCRAMANMGISELLLVDAHNLDMEEARKMACHAGDILDGRRELSTLADAVEDCVAVAGTTARRGLYRQHARTPREWAPALAGLAARGPVAIVFGREDKGLSNDEIALCTHLMQIPTSTEYSSLNLSQAVMVCCYELFAVLDSFEAVTEKSELAEAGIRERMFEMWRELLLSVGFMKPEKADHMMHGLRRVLSRGALSNDDVNIMMGVARQCDWAAHAMPGKIIEIEHECREIKNSNTMEGVLNE